MHWNYCFPFVLEWFMSTLNSFRSPCCMVSCAGQQPALMSLWPTLCSSYSSTLSQKIVIAWIGSIHSDILCKQFHSLYSLSWTVTPVADGDPEEPCRSPWLPSALYCLLCNLRSVSGVASLHPRSGHLHQYFKNIQVVHTKRTPLTLYKMIHTSYGTRIVVYH